MVRARRVVVRQIRFGAFLFALGVFLVSDRDETIGYFGSGAAKPYKPLEIKDPGRAEYVANIESAIAEHSRLARLLRRRYLLSASVSIVAAGAVPVCVAVPVSAWLTALLGGVAAAVQGIQQLLQDGRLSVEHHLLAGRLSNFQANADGRSPRGEGGCRLQVVRRADAGHHETGWWGNPERSRNPRFEQPPFEIRLIYRADPLASQM